jgi:hypothetical protein
MQHLSSDYRAEDVVNEAETEKIIAINATQKKVVAAFHNDGVVAIRDLGIVPKRFHIRSTSYA